MKYLLTLTALLFIGCGDATDTTSATQASPEAIEMVIDKSYSVYTGDHIDKQTNDATLSITKNIEGESTTVVLLQGSAQLIRAN